MGEKLKRKPLSSPVSVKAVRWKGWGLRTVYAIALHRKTKTNPNPESLTLTDTGGAVLTLMLGSIQKFIHFAIAGCHTHHGYKTEIETVSLHQKSYITNLQVS